jgi:hypothetical protein
MMFLAISSVLSRPAFVEARNRRAVEAAEILQLCAIW